MKTLALVQTMIPFTSAGIRKILKRKLDISLLVCLPDLTIVKMLLQINQASLKILSNGLITGKRSCYIEFTDNMRLWVFPIHCDGG